MSALRQGGRDLLRMAREIEVFFRSMCAKEDCRVGLGLLSAASNVARKGQSSRYMVRIANAGRDRLDVRLTIAICAGKLPGACAGHDVSFTKRLTVQPCSALALAIEYDWIAPAMFHPDGDALPADDFWSGTVDTPQLYAVTAVLCDLEGRRLDGLTVYQDCIE